MSAESGVLDQGRSLSWSETWIKALTQPSEASYAEIVNDPGAAPRKAYIWIFISSLVGFIIYILIGSLFGTNVIGAGMYSWIDDRGGFMWRANREFICRAWNYDQCWDKSVDRQCFRRNGDIF